VRPLRSSPLLWLLLFGYWLLGIAGRPPTGNGACNCVLWVGGPARRPIRSAIFDQASRDAHSHWLVSFVALARVGV